MIPLWAILALLILSFLVVAGVLIFISYRVDYLFMKSTMHDTTLRVLYDKIEALEAKRPNAS